MSRSDRHPDRHPDPKIGPQVYLGPITKTDKCDNVEIVDEVEAIKKKRSYEGSFLGWYDIVLD